MSANTDMKDIITAAFKTLVAKVDSPQDVTLMNSMFTTSLTKLSTTLNLVTNTALIDTNTDELSAHFHKEQAKSLFDFTQSGLYYILPVDTISDLPTGETEGLLWLTRIKSVADNVDRRYFIFISTNTLREYTVMYNAGDAIPTMLPTVKIDDLGVSTTETWSSDKAKTYTDVTSTMKAIIFG